MEEGTTGAGRAAGGWKRRLAVVASAVVVAVVVYLVARLVLADGLRAPEMDDRASMEVTIGAVIVASALASLLGWGLLALLERFTARAVTIWRVVAVVVALLSLSAPLTGAGISTGNRIGLLLLHVAVAAVLIPLLPGSPARDRAPAT
jgi:hypothetical protein